jgi:hypothetical protein
MYINAAADSVMLYSQHDFYNIIFTIKQIIIHNYIQPKGQLTPPPLNRKILGAHLHRRIASEPSAHSDRLEYCRWINIKPQIIRNILFPNEARFAHDFVDSTKD